MFVSDLAQGIAGLDGVRTTAAFGLSERVGRSGAFGGEGGECGALGVARGRGERGRMRGRFGESRARESRAWGERILNEGLGGDLLDVFGEAALGVGRRLRERFDGRRRGCRLRDLRRRRVLNFHGRITV